MQTILVPVDFSTTAYNAAVYALELGKQLQVQKVILYHSYELPVVSDGGLAVPLLVGVDDIQKTSSEALENLLNNLKEKVEYVPFEIETYHTYNSTVNGIKEAVQEKQANLIVMGITGGNAIEQALIGSNTIEVSKEVTIPLIIVPANATFKPIRNTVLACSMNNIYDNMPIEHILNFITNAKSNFQVLHVETNGKMSDYSGTNFESMALHTLFAEHVPKYHFVHNTNFIEGVNDFADKNSTDMVIVIPQKHGLFESLFTKSHTKQLAFHSHVPIMVVHD